MAGSEGSKDTGETVRKVSGKGGQDVKAAGKQPAPASQQAEKREAQKVVEEGYEAASPPERQGDGDPAPRNEKEDAATKVK